MSNRTTPHKHAEIIKAWADGAAIECRNPADATWTDTANPLWAAHREYRIKPEPLVLEETIGYGGKFGMCFTESRWEGPPSKMRFTVDRTTRTILSVELVKE